MEKKKIIILSALIAGLILLLLLILLIPKPDTQTPTPTTGQTPATEATESATEVGATQSPTDSATEPATEPSATQSPPDDSLRNPLTGQVLEAPYDGRIFAVSINNSKSALPFHGVSQADILFEMYINDYATRCLALFSNVSDVESIGSIRSTRYNFTDIALAYNCIVTHANASSAVRADMLASGIDQMNADGTIGYRDYDRYNNRGYAWEHCLFATGSNLKKAAEKKGFALTVSGADYGLHFSEDTVTAGGEPAGQIDIVFTIGTHQKTTSMKYDAATGKYIFWQYNQKMTDENNGADVGFENVIVMLAENTNSGSYHIADLYGEGDGYFACGGTVIPIRWVHVSETDPFTFFLTDGTPLTQAVGSTYIAIAPIGSTVKY